MGARLAAAPGHDSVRYWTGVVFQTGRAGNLDYASNQSILAVLARAGLDPHSPAGMAIWLALSAIAAAVACRGMRYAFAAAEDCMALSLNAFAAIILLLASAAAIFPAVRVPGTVCTRSSADGAPQAGAVR